MVKIKMKLGKRNVTAILVLITIFGIVVLGVLNYYFLIPKPITTWDYFGNTLVFRVDLREANKVPVYPHETGVYLDVVNPLVKNITIAFKPAGDKENPYYQLEIIELVMKLKQYVYDRKEIPVEFNAVPIESYENLPGKIQNPIIALVHPIYANETAIRNAGHVTTISGKTYNEFDLAVAKFLMVALGIELVNE